MLPFRTEHLANGVVLAFVDRSNRYFGDYHRICVEVRMSIPTAEGPLTRVRRLERMGVPGAEVTLARDRLVEGFLRHAGSYLAHADYPLRLAAAESGKRQPQARR